VVRIATAGSKVFDSLNTDVQGFHFLSDDALGRTPIQVVHQKSSTEVLWEHEGMETHAVFP